MFIFHSSGSLTQMTRLPSAGSKGSSFWPEMGRTPSLVPSSAPGDYQDFGLPNHNPQLNIEQRAAQKLGESRVKNGSKLGLCS